MSARTLVLASVASLLVAANGAPAQQVVFPQMIATIDDPGAAFDPGPYPVQRLTSTVVADTFLYQPTAQQAAQEAADKILAGIAAGRLARGNISIRLSGWGLDNFGLTDTTHINWPTRFFCEADRLPGFVTDYTPASAPGGGWPHPRIADNTDGGTARDAEVVAGLRDRGPARGGA